MTENKPFRIELHEENVKVNPFVDGKIRKFLGDFEEQINSHDGNHNKIPDVQEAHDLLMDAMPKVLVASQQMAAISESVDFEAIAKDFADSPYIKDHAKFANAILGMGKVAEELGRIVEKAQPLLLVTAASLQPKE